MTEIVVVEREVDTPADPDAMMRAEEAVAWCFEQHRVTFLYTFVACDRLRATCLYAAPDVEAVRSTQRAAGIPVTRMWRATLTGDPLAGVRDYTLAVAPRAAAAELAARGLAPVVQLVARDGRRWVAAFAAPVEDVRAACAAIDLPAAVWAVEVKDSPG